MAKDEKDLIIEQRDKTIAELQATIDSLVKYVAELERKLKINSSNSSMPPSSDPPWTEEKKPPKRKRKKRGARKGHSANLKKPVPPEDVTRRVTLKPEVCPGCGGTHFNETDEEPLVNQTIDMPPIKPDVLEITRPTLECAACGTRSYAALPDDAKDVFQPGVVALVAVLTGVLNISKRKTETVLNELFKIPISLGGVSNCERKIAESLEAPYEEALTAARELPVAHADETSWRLGNRVKGWMWTLCGATVAAFKIQAGRGKEAARELLGAFSGVLVTDRWGGYNFFAGLRQICWAHLMRDFRAISECSGDLGLDGRILLDKAKEILALRKRVRDGTLQWKTFQSRMIPLMAHVETILADAAALDGPLSGKCAEIYKCKDYLWTFVYRQDVEPTNNHAERTVRPCVLWRKMSFGTQSERGARYVERILTVTATCRLQSKSVIEYLRAACENYSKKLPAPALIG